MKRVCVLGGGISGIAAAYFLSRNPALEVHLLEASERLGGVLQTEQVGDYLIERSADNFATLIPDAYELSTSCGLEQELIRPNAHGRQAFIYLKGKIRPIPAGFSLMQPTRVWSILTTPTLSVAGKLRLLGEYWVPKRTSESDESLHDFAIRRLGQEAYENLVEPIVSGIFTADPKTLSMEATMSQFVGMERAYGSLIRAHLVAKKNDAAAAARKASGARYDQFVAPKFGMSSWVAQLASKLPSGCVQLQRTVTGLISIGDGRWVVNSRSSSGDAGHEHLSAEFDAIVSALPAARTSALVHEFSPVAANLLLSIEYASSAVAAVVVNREDLVGRVDGFGLIVPQKERRNALAISYTSNKYPDRTPNGEILLRVFMGGALKPEIMAQSDDQLMELAYAELRHILGWQGKRSNWSQIIRWDNAMPQYTLGHVARVKQIMQELASHKTIQVCGAAYEGVGIPQCVRSAKRAAQAVESALLTMS